MLYRTLVQVQHLIFLDKVVYMQRSTIVVDGENYVAGNKIKVRYRLRWYQLPTMHPTITAVATDGSITSASMPGTAVNGDTVQTFSTVTIEILTGNITTNTTLAFRGIGNS